MNKELFCVALLIADDGMSSGYCKKECTIDDLNKLKEEDRKDFISLIGWLPIEFYNGGDVSEFNKNFIYYEAVL